MIEFAQRLLSSARKLAVAALERLRRPTRRGLLLALAVPPALFVLYVLLLIPFTPGIGDIRKARVDRPARILSSDGKLLAEFKPSNREWVKLADISPRVIDALIATEDHRFYEHHGIDWRRTAGAALHTFSGDRQGGSTITQQLARNLYPEQIGRAPTLTRKLKEAITALKIEAVYRKDEILETYLNTVPFLYNAYGIEMAARTYFDKSASDLDVREAATLIGMLKGNAYYNPVINPERALQRRNTVLSQMVKYGKLTPAQFAQLKTRPLGVDFERQTEPPGPAPHFARYLRKWLIAWADRNDYNIYSDGLVVHTTIDARLQAMATQAVAWQANQLQGVANRAWSGRDGCSAANPLFVAFVRESAEYRAALAAGRSEQDAMKQLTRDREFMRNLCASKTDVQAGFLAIDPRTGQIRAWVGSRDFVREPFDHVQQARRQPGSTFKPFVYGAAFAAGAKADDKLTDQPVEIALKGGEIWRPADEAPPTGEAFTLRRALALSRNRITAQVIERVGPNKVARLARAMGVRESPLEEVPSLALGTSPVTLMEMVSAYSTIADDGIYRAPRMVTRIDDAEGNVLAEFAPSQAERALDADVDRTLVDAMRDVVTYGTGSSIRSRFGIRADVAGKTGTTQDSADGWFILMHSQLVAGAWVGFDDGRVTLRSDYWGQGAHTALPIVGDFFQRALRARIVDARARFDTAVEPSAFEQFRTRLSERLQAWRETLFGAKAPQLSQPSQPSNGQAVRRRPPPAPEASEASSAAAANVPAASEVDAIGAFALPDASAPAGASSAAPAVSSPALPPILGAPASRPAGTSPPEPADTEPPAVPASPPGSAPRSEPGASAGTGN
ncbi:transglycosylase domain-containing protein [Trinickia caryophylli]|uniref:Penicillin-binding protein 1A n=1 Tax=Trinickia caryophylli TaxID=28094 RepID=A0A1X7D4R0_TRICW|nr:transglycosylase domain-containing protein [Trinickia caryophylli]PMS12731.1 penicillin-binding protein [Trinickia caryophylli]TRX15138.1 penicillin-binding protein [Trinickia caryophylli]WQE15002.1 transglycosylase domain-containing protein [Trinickia caryophylli]SMF08922.1 penicillin-binding protein 1A [Trinickia caryophylli]GLU31269.1 penicillin-binding protein 1A [Trinickia caryophylli]